MLTCMLEQCDFVMGFLFLLFSWSKVNRPYIILEFLNKPLI